ncbi:MAG: FadR/GntR family transcriptional regulator [Actinomycetota bacterium]
MSKREKTPRVIIDHILKDIKEGNLTSGQALPSQKELCKKYNTGRGSVREALQALELVDILEVKPGIGTFIKDFSLSSFFNPARLIYRPDDKLIPDLLEFREIFETIVVNIAIDNATQEDIGNLRENLELTKFYVEKENKEQFVKLDYEFHNKLADSTNNKVIKNYFDVIFPLLKYSISEILIDTTEIPGVMVDTYHDHKKIFEGIKSRNKKTAVESLKDHINFVKRNFNLISKNKIQNKN